MIHINDHLHIPLSEVKLTAIRSGGPGGQHVNKVATAIQLSFDIAFSSLPEGIKDRLRQMRDRRISRDGIIVIKAQKYRSQLRNKEAAIETLADLIRQAARPPKKRKHTRPTRSSQLKRLSDKKIRSQRKSERGRIEF